MPDALVRELNRLGFQPVFLPETGFEPPELYNYAPETQRLVRRGPLAKYLAAAKNVEVEEGELADISYKHTSDKKLDASISFLENALRAIGISAVPKIDLGFAGTTSFAFSFTGVTYKRVDPASLDPIIRGMKTAGIPQKYLDAGQLHIAYQYAYARELLMTRSDRKAFSTDIMGDVGAYIDLGVKGSVSVANDSTIAFKSASSSPAAFAYKAGRLRQEEHNGPWVFDPEVVSRKGLVETSQPFIPQRAIVLFAESQPE
ncbi:MAG TPA: hypothetical protein VN706_05435 [Gemmatimonadaceae bacterium]|nr:hypothetical protein [Gemmatimonadaceae bacterium]